MAQSDFLTRQRQEIRNRLAELRPYYEEYLNLETVENALDEVSNSAPTAVRRRGPGRPRKSTTNRGPGRPRKVAAEPASSSKGGRRSSTRADQTLKLITKNPGISVPEIAKRLGIQQNYVYRVVNKLQAGNMVKRSGRGLHTA